MILHNVKVNKSGLRKKTGSETGFAGKQFLVCARRSSVENNHSLIYCIPGHQVGVGLQLSALAGSN